MRRDLRKPRRYPSAKMRAADVAVTAIAPLGQEEGLSYAKIFAVFALFAGLLYGIGRYKGLY